MEGGKKGRRKRVRRPVRWWLGQSALRGVISRLGEGKRSEWEGGRRYMICFIKM